MGWYPRRVPSCYFLAVCAGSSIDQNTNNASLFNLVERVNIAPNQQVPAGAAIPLEVHAHWRLDPTGEQDGFDVRLVMRADSQLETSSPVFSHQPKTPRFRAKMMGVPYPPVPGDYTLHVDWRRAEESEWHREPVCWPISIAVAEKRPRVTH